MVRGFTEVQVETSTVFPSSTKQVIKEILLVKQGLPFINPHWLGLVPKAKIFCKVQDCIEISILDKMSSSWLNLVCKDSRNN